MAMGIFKKDELFEVDGKFVEKKWAFPDLKGEQTAIMLRWVDGKWELSLWGAAIDGVGTVACGWEPCIESNAETVISHVKVLMEEIEKGVDKPPNL